MFKIETDPQFTHPVKVAMPTDGGFETQTFKARFRLLSADEMAKHELNTGPGQEVFLNCVIVALFDIVDDEGDEVPFSDAVLAKVVGSIPARNALLATYTAACTKAQAGN